MVVILSSLISKIQEYIAALIVVNKNVKANNLDETELWNIVKEALFLQILMNLSKIFDNEKTCGNENCSLRLLQSSLKNDDAKYVELMEQIDAIYRDYEQVVPRSIRNKKLAHFDLNEIVNGEPTTIDLDDVKSIVLSLCSLITIISEQMLGFAEINFPPIDLLVEHMEQSTGNLFV